MAAGFKVGVLGAGGMGLHVAETLQSNPLVREIVAFDIRAEQIQAARQKLHVTGTTDLRTVLDDPQVRLVFVTAPNDAHRELTFEALAAGKAVMCEKPMATTLADDLRHVHNTTDQTHDIVRRVAEGQPPKTSARDAFETMKLCFATEKSADRGRVVNLAEMDSAGCRASDEIGSGRGRLGS